MFVDNNWIYAPNRSVTKKLDTGVILSFNDYNKDNKHKQAVLDSVNFETNDLGYLLFPHASEIFAETEREERLI